MHTFIFIESMFARVDLSTILVKKPDHRFSFTMTVDRGGRV